MNHGKMFMNMKMAIVCVHFKQLTKETVEKAITTDELVVHYGSHRKFIHDFDYTHEFIFY